jgi:rare lipoprotein A
MQKHRLSFWVYWLTAAGLIGLIGSGNLVESKVSPQAEETATNAVASEATLTAAVLSESVSGEPDMSLASDQVGLASWYGNQHQGRLTASGQPFDEAKLTAAHRTLPLATRVKVTNLENGRSVVVKVNDRGPYIAGRVLDLSTRAAQQLDMQKEGLALVRIEVLPMQLASAAGN